MPRTRCATPAACSAGAGRRSFASDLGGGKFDGAYLVDNFESLNPANTFFGKAYNLFAKIDTEPERYLEFERWWGGYFLMNREEIRWIVDNLFVGNKLAAGSAEWSEGQRLRPARHPLAHHPVRLARRQHHPAAAGLQLGRRSLPHDRGPQGERTGDRRA